MSLASNFAAVQAGCTAVPQHGFEQTDAPALYQMRYKQGGRDVFWRFNYPVWVHWDCPSPPAVVRLYFLEHPELEVNTDPIFTITTFLGACGSLGTYLGTSLWFRCVGLACNWATQAPAPATWIHLQNYKTNSGSIGFTDYLTPPV